MKWNALGRPTGRTVSLAAAATLLACFPAAAQKTIYSFKGDPDGAAPVAPLVRDAAGNLYGTSYIGGTNNGTVFKVSSAGKESILHTFSGPDGSAPWGGLVRDAAGNLYGTTAYGGAFDSGTVFKITAAGEESVLYSFAGPPSDGGNPFAGLVMDSEGNLYGTTEFGGSGNCTGGNGQKGCGTVFKVSASGVESVLHVFQGGADGVYPNSALIRDAAGTLYGTTSQGGQANCSNLAADGCGTVFSVTSAGVETALYAFSGAPTDGEYPQGLTLVGGNLYGTTQMGGTYSGGTVFEVTSAGSESLLYSFGAVANDALNPAGGLVWDGAGHFYGTSMTGGIPGCSPNSGCGTVFVVTTTGKERVVAQTSEFTGGCVPYAPLIRDAAGYLYGTTSNCGGFGWGTVFAVKP